MTTRRGLQTFLAVPSILFMALVGISACRQDDAGERAAPASDAFPPVVAAPALVQVTAVDYAFGAPAEIPSGWTTFRMKNQGREHHVLLLYRLPEGRTFEDYLELTEPFEQVLQALEEGKVEAGGVLRMLREALPDWSAAIEPMGGPGLLASGETGQASVELEPGDYVMECYVKTPEGRLHASLGMVRPLTVTSEPGSPSPPRADAEMTLSGGDFEMEDALGPGVHTIAVRFTGSPPDVHLARVTENTDRSGLASWLDLLQVDGMREPAPARFLGGVGGMPPGHTAYFTVDLSPGRYAWVSAPTPTGENVKEFVVE